MEINGMAHVVFTAGNFQPSKEFYRKFLPFPGMTLVMDNDVFLYGVDASPAPGIRPPDKEFEGGKLENY